MTSKLLGNRASLARHNPDKVNMASQTIGDALVLGILEGLTEFIPVSSTGHILLAGHFLGFESTGKTFEVLIQLGAILAILSVYSAGCGKSLIDLPRDPRTRVSSLGILIAFLPAAVIGALAHDFIKTVLFETPKLICIMLILGGLVLFWVDRWALSRNITTSWISRCPVCLGIGLFQCLAMIPGTSRSGATIVGSLLLGADKRSAAEFSFFLAMPTMAGAFVFDLVKNRDILSIRRRAGDRHRLHRRLRRGGHRRALPARLRVASRLRAVRLVAADRRRRRPRRCS